MVKNINCDITYDHYYSIIYQCNVIEEFSKEFQKLLVTDIKFKHQF